MQDKPITPAYRATVMTMLIIVYAFNFLDRQIVSILAVPIKASLGLSDTQLGLMGGFAFALFYTTLGVPVALLADRANRAWILTVSLALWSGMTALCGLAQNFWQLFAARVGVGIGEAGGVAPSFSVISDYFPPEQRGRALSVFGFAIPIGSALGIVIGGILASRIDWRYAFIAIGLAGVLFAPLFRLVVREPKRGQYDPPSTDPAPSFTSVLSVLRDKKSFWLLALGGATASIPGYGMFFWLPSLFVRSHAMPLLDASLYFGAMLLIGGIAGMWSGGALSDRFGRKSCEAYAVVPGIAFLLCVPLYVSGAGAGSKVLMFGLLLATLAVSLAWLGPVTAAIQQIVAPSMRATTGALNLLVTNLIGLGLGVPLLGFLSDSLTERYGDGALKMALIGSASLYIPAALFMLLASRHLRQDWHAQ